MQTFQDKPPPTNQTPRKPSVGDLIKLDSKSSLLSASGGQQSEVIFDPLMEVRTAGQPLPSSPAPPMPKPPSLSTLPQISQLLEQQQPTAHAQHRPLERANNNANPFNPFSGVVVNGNNAAGAPLRPGPTVDRSVFTKSSDDLLQEYGIDFSKLAVASKPVLTATPPQPVIQASRLNNQVPTKEDVFADLDPLRKTSSPGPVAAESMATAGRPQPRVSLPNQSYAGNQPMSQMVNGLQVSPSGVVFPVAPPRGVRKSQPSSWTTFD